MYCEMNQPYLPIMAYFWCVLVVGINAFRVFIDCRFALFILSSISYNLEIIDVN